MTLQNLQADVDKWIKKFGIKYFHQLTNLGILNEEVGEVSRYIVRLYGEQSFKKETDAANAHEKLAEELCDVLFVLTCLANQCDVDLEKEMIKNLEKKTQRDAQRHQKNPKLSQP